MAEDERKEPPKGTAAATCLWKGVEVVPGLLAASYVATHAAKQNPIDDTEWAFDVDINWLLLGKYELKQTIQMTSCWSESKGFFDVEIQEEFTKKLFTDKRVLYGALVRCISDAANVLEGADFTSKDELPPAKHSTTRPGWEMYPIDELQSFFESLRAHVPANSSNDTALAVPPPARST